MQFFKKPEALFFDLDGTLIDTIAQLSKAAQKTALSIGVDAPSLETTKSFVGNGVQLLLARVIEGRFDVDLSLVDKELLKKARQVFNEVYLQGLKDDFKVYPQVFETLDYCRENGIKTAVITNKPYIFAEPLLSYANLSDRFDFILGGEILDKKKPDPPPLNYVREKLNLKTNNIGMVGDSDNDMLPAVALNLCSIFFTFGYCRKKISEIVSDYKFSSYGELLDLLKSLS